MMRFLQEPVSGKGPASLALRMASSVTVFVLLGSLALVWAFELRIKREERHAFEELARVNASFLERTRLPQSAQMAAQLGEIIGAEVFFWEPSTAGVIGRRGVRPPTALHGMSFDGRVKPAGDNQWMVGLPGRDGMMVVFLKPVSTRMSAMDRPDTWLALGIFWLLSLALGWGLAHMVTKPLRGIVESLTLVGTENDFPQLPVSRGDEIGQLARTLTLTHETLREERELRRSAERHALLGRMAACLAHEVRNPVAAIRLHAQLLEGANPVEAMVSRQLIESEAARIEELVNQWFNHTRPVPPVLADTDVYDSLDKARQLIDPQARHSRVRIEIAGMITSPLIIPADQHRLQQVFGNVLRNAVQAMPSGGLVTVRVLDADSRVAVIVEDEGQGFSPSALARLGEPFYSEKEGGLGLGLAVAKEICLAHGGVLGVENLPSGGAMVRLEFSKNPRQSSTVTPATAHTR